MPTDAEIIAKWFAPYFAFNRDGVSHERMVKAAQNALDEIEAAKTSSEWISHQVSVQL